jgi:hypothetical protein
VAKACINVNGGEEPYGGWRLDPLFLEGGEGVMVVETSVDPIFEYN